jgi:hypothetical protein
LLQVLNLLKNAARLPQRITSLIAD